MTTEKQISRFLETTMFGPTRSEIDALLYNFKVIRRSSEGVRHSVGKLISSSFV